MWKCLLLLLVVGLMAIEARAPAQPKLSDTFFATINITVVDKYGEHKGHGQWGVNQKAGKSCEWNDFDSVEYGFYNLERFDLGKQYELSARTDKCLEFAVNGTMPGVWDWLALSTFVGTVGQGRDAVDVWEATIGYATLKIAVNHDVPTTPIYLIRQSRDEKKTSYWFHSWSNSAPEDKFFDVPPNCEQASSVQPIDVENACVARSTAISRAKVWVADKVPYNQGATHDGYREDCSGYVSMCWESSKPGHTTSTFHEISHPISKDDLQPGDCLLYATEHVVLFGGWTNSAKTEYQAYEETRPGEGTVTRPTPYPYWYSQSSFKPYRYNDIC